MHNVYPKSEPIMTEELIESIKQKGSWPIKNSGIFGYIILLICQLPIFLLLRSCIIDEVYDLKFVPYMAMIMVLFQLLFISVRLYQNKHFYSLSIPNLSEWQINAALKKTKFQNVEYNKLGYYTLYSAFHLYSWGEEITIILDNDRLLINSKPINATIFQSITIIKDRKNNKILIDELKKMSTNCNIKTDCRNEP